MKTTKRQLRRVVRETLIREAEFYSEAPEAETVMKAAGLTPKEISLMRPFIKGTSNTEFLETPMFEKLFGWFAFDGPEEDKMPYGCAKARDGCPDEWILDRLEMGPGAQRWLGEAITDHWDNRDKIAMSGMDLEDEYSRWATVPQVQKMALDAGVRLSYGDAKTLAGQTQAEYGALQALKKSLQSGTWQRMIR